MRHSTVEDKPETTLFRHTSEDLRKVGQASCLACSPAFSSDVPTVDPSAGFAILRGMNRLIFGDSLPWLQNHNVLPGGCVEFGYFAPPFNSYAKNNVVFMEW